MLPGADGLQNHVRRFTFGMVKKKSAEAAAEAVRKKS